VNARSTGPGPLRTARGAGRRAEVFFAAGFLLVVLRERELVVFFAPEREEELVLLRDPGGEDVRVAMTPNLGDRPTCLRDHTAVCRRRPGGCSAVRTELRRLSLIFLDLPHDPVLGCRTRAWSERHSDLADDTHPPKEQDT
jgi:hypothetical protein